MHLTYGLGCPALLTRMDKLGKPAWAFAAVLGAWLFWPFGLAILAYLAWTGRLRAMRAAPGRWSNLRGGASASPAAPSGSRAFDEYRATALRGLEKEEREFQAYLERLRRARDKTEFDRFMAERRRRTASLPTVTSPDQPSGETLT